LHTRIAAACSVVVLSITRLLITRAQLLLLSFLRDRWRPGVARAAGLRAGRGEIEEGRS
jgi:hypothetical protein